MIDMDKSTCLEKIFNDLKFIVDHGFQPRLREVEYRRQRGEFYDFFRIEISRIHDRYVVAPSVFLGVPEINRLLNKIFDKRRSANSTTFGFGINNKYRNERGNYLIRTHEDFSGVNSHLASDFREVALPWFEKFFGVAEIDDYLNSPDATGKYKPESVGYACKGLVAAHLSGNPNLRLLADTYHSYFVEAQTEEIANPILVARDFFT